MRSTATTERERTWIDASNAIRATAQALRSGWIDPKALERKQAWTDTIVGTGATHAVTLIWNPEDGKLGQGQVRIDTAKLHCRVDRALMGKRFNTMPVGLRSGYVGFIEHPETNTHAHFAWRVPIKHHLRFETVLRERWDHLHPYGNADVQVLYDAAGWASYMSKDQWRTSHADDAALLLASHTIRT